MNLGRFPDQQQMHALGKAGKYGVRLEALLCRKCARKRLLRI